MRKRAFHMPCSSAMKSATYMLVKASKELELEAFSLSLLQIRITIKQEYSRW